MDLLGTNSCLITEYKETVDGKSVLRLALLPCTGAPPVQPLEGHAVNVPVVDPVGSPLDAKVENGAINKILLTGGGSVFGA